jgi:hypothetical protein
MMWCDAWDGDLYRLVPEARAIVAPVAEVRLVTNGRMADGALSHPAVWHGDEGMLAWFARTNHEPGWTGPGRVAPDVYWTDDPLVACTGEQAVRDCWGHHYAIILVPAWRRIWDMTHQGWILMDLLSDARGIQRLDAGAIAGRRGLVIHSLEAAVARLQRLVPVRLEEA